MASRLDFGEGLHFLEEGSSGGIKNALSAGRQNPPLIWHSEYVQQFSTCDFVGVLD